MVFYGGEEINPPSEIHYGGLLTAVGFFCSVMPELHPTPQLPDKIVWLLLNQMHHVC